MKIVLSIKNTMIAKRNILINNNLLQRSYFLCSAEAGQTHPDQTSEISKKPPWDISVRVKRYKTVMYGFSSTTGFQQSTKHPRLAKDYKSLLNTLE